MGKDSKLKTYTAMVIYTLSIGFSFLGIKVCVKTGDSLDILFYRYLFALFALAAWLGIARAAGTSAKPPKARPKSRLYLTAGFYLAFMVFQVVALFFSTSIEAAIVSAVMPIISKIIGRVFLGEKSTLRQYFFMGLTVSSLCILVVAGAASIEMSVPGIIFMITASTMMSISNVFMRYVRGSFQPIEITRCIIIGGFVLFTAAVLIKNFLQAGSAAGALALLIEPARHPSFLIAAAFLGIFCILLSAQFASYALARLEIIQFTVFGNVSTAISIVAGAVFLHESLRWFHILCSALILFGVIGMTMSPAPEENSGKKLGENR